MNINKIVAECNPLELPSVSLSQKMKLTFSAGVYFVLHENRILYIGKSDCIKSRWVNHNQLIGSFKNIVSLQMRILVGDERSF